MIYKKFKPANRTEEVIYVLHEIITCYGKQQILKSTINPLSIEDQMKQRNSIGIQEYIKIIKDFNIKSASNIAFRTKLIKVFNQ